MTQIKKFYQFLQQFNTLLFIVADIPVLVHWTLWLVLFILFVFDPATGYIYLLMILSIVPHEFGHALAARFYDIKCTKITMFPIGGIALIQEMPKEALKEFVIAAAGPLVSVAIAAIAGLGYMMIGATILAKICFINTAIFAFNMLPCLPMDGGRLFRSTLAFFLSHKNATKIAAVSSQILCIIMMGLGIYTGFVTFAVTFFVIMMMAMVEYRTTSEG